MHKRRERWRNARMHFTITSTSFGESLGALALRHRDEIVGRARARVAANVAAFERTVKDLQGLLAWVPLRGGTTAFPWLTFASDTRPFAEALAAQGVLVVPGDCFGMPRHFRVGFGACPDFPAALRILEEVTRDSRGEGVHGGRLRGGRPGLTPGPRRGPGPRPYPRNPLVPRGLASLLTPAHARASHGVDGGRGCPGRRTGTLG